MTLPHFEVAPRDLCVSLDMRSNADKTVDVVTACGSQRLGATMAIARAELVLLRLGQMQTAQATIEACDEHGLEGLVDDELVTDRFERFAPLECGRLLVLKKLSAEREGISLDLALVRRLADVLMPDLVMVRWPIEGMNPQRIASLLGQVALTVERDDPAWLFQRTCERWPLEFLRREDLPPLLFDKAG